MDANAAALLLQKLWRGSLGRKEATRAQLIRERDKIKSKRRSRIQNGARNLERGKYEGEGSTIVSSVGYMSSDSLLDYGAIPIHSNLEKIKNLNQCTVANLDGVPVYETTKKQKPINISNFLSPSRVNDSLASMNTAKNGGKGGCTPSGEKLLFTII